MAKKKEAILQGKSRKADRGGERTRYLSTLRKRDLKKSQQQRGEWEEGKEVISTEESKVSTAQSILSLPAEKYQLFWGEVTHGREGGGWGLN